MSYEVNWDTPGKVLYLKLDDELLLNEFIEINDQINEYMKGEDRIALIVDALGMRIAPYGIERIKSTQKYLQSYQISHVMVVVDNKLNRLVMLLLFNLCRPKLQFCPTIEQAQRMLGVSRSQRT